jgi:hypothetical protein
MASVDLPGAAEVPRHRIKPNKLVWFRSGEDETGAAIL